MTFVAGDAPAAGRRSVPTVRIRHRATPIAATVRPATAAEPARGGRWIVETDSPVWAAAPGQAAVLYDGDVVLGGGRIARPASRRSRRRHRPRARPWTGRPSARGRRRTAVAVSLDPALILAVLVGIFHASLYVLIRGNAGGRLPIIVVAVDPRGVGRRRPRRSAWLGSSCPIGDFQLLAASVVAWIGIAISSAWRSSARPMRRT